MSSGYSKRSTSTIEVIRNMIDARLAVFWTALPAIVVGEPDYETMTISVQCALTFTHQTSTYEQEIVEMPILDKVPFVYPGSGGYQITIPIKEGDECLLVFASRCIDNWWASGGVQPQFEYRINDIGDAFAFLGVRSNPRTMDALSQDNPRPYQPDRFEIRKDDGTAWISLTDENDIDIEAQHLTAHFSGNQTATIEGDYTFTISGSNTLNITGNSTINIKENASVTINGNATIDVTGDITATCANLSVTAQTSASVESTKVDVTASGQCTVTSPQTTLTGGMVQTTAGACAPTGMGGFCGLPSCLFTGAPHVGNIIAGA